jgi:hypothetical protein
MRRATEFCKWREQWWKEQIGRRSEVPSHLAEGLRAYALEHASVEKLREERWNNRWAPIRKRIEIILQCLGDAKFDLEAILRRMGTLEVEIDHRDTNTELGVEEEVE